MFSNVSIGDKFLLGNDIITIDRIVVDRFCYGHLTFDKQTGKCVNYPEFPALKKVVLNV